MRVLTNYLLFCCLFLSSLSHDLQAQFPPFPFMEPTQTSEDFMKDALDHYKDGEYNQALRLFNVAVDTNQFEELKDILFYYRAHTYWKLDKLEAAVMDFDSAIVANNEKSHYFYYRSRVKLQQERIDASIEDLGRAIALEEQSNYYSKRGFLYHKRGQQEKALADFNKAIELDEQAAEAYYNRGVLMFRMLNPKGGCADFQKAVDLGWEAAKAAQERYCGK